MTPRYSSTVTLFRVGDVDYVADHRTRTITPVDAVSERIVGLLHSGVDGLSVSWASAPVSIQVLALDAGAAFGLDVTFPRYRFDESGRPLDVVDAEM